MSSESGSVSVWPGYVAAVSCLVLSLLLLAAIVVSLITQLGTLAAAHNETLRQAALKRYESPGEEAAQASQSSPAELSAGAAPARAPTVLKRPGESAAASVELPRQGAQPLVRSAGELRLVFDASLADIPASQFKDLAAALDQIDAPPGGRWQIWAAAPEADALASRTTFKLMLAVRSYMVKAGIAESLMDLRLVPPNAAPERARRGEIVIHVVPQRQLPAAQRSS